MAAEARDPETPPGQARASRREMKILVGYTPELFFAFASEQ